jgi:hypothetical protein
MAVSEDMHMNRVFTIEHGITVPDGTVVYPFLNPMDSTSGLPWDLIEGFSIAAGDIAPHSKSKIVVSPLVTQATFVLRGALDIHLKDPESPAPYVLNLVAEQAAIACPGTFFQLINGTDAPCRVLYIVSPPYVFEIDRPDGPPRYDDAVVFDEDWQALADQNWQPPGLHAAGITLESRQAAQDRLARQAMTPVPPDSTTNLT